MKSWGSHQQLDGATTKYHTIGHHISNTFYALCIWSTLFPQSNLQLHYTHKSTRLRTSTTLSLCCLLWCTIIKNEKRTNTICFQFWSTIIKDQSKIYIKVRCFQINKMKRRNQWGTRRQGIQIEEARSWEHKNYKVQKDL